MQNENAAAALMTTAGFHRVIRSITTWNFTTYQLALIKFHWLSGDNRGNKTEHQHGSGND